MKKILFYTAVTILAAVACNKIEEDPQQQINAESFVASVEEVDSKTLIDDLDSYWNGEEKIWVLNGKGDWKKEYATTVNKVKRATFVQTDPSTTLSGNNYLAVYPANPAGNVSWSGKISDYASKFWLANNQNPTKDSFDPETHIAIAYSTTESLDFKNVTSLVRVNLTSDNVSTIYFYGNNGETISGNFDVKYNNGNPIVDLTKKEGYFQSTNSNIQAKSGNLPKGVYYISVLPNTFEKGFSIELVSAGKKSIKRNSNKYTLDRGKVLDLGDQAWSESSDKVIYFKPNNWNTADAKFVAYSWKDGGSNKFTLLKEIVKGDVWACKIPNEHTKVIFLRKSTASLDWNNEWNRVGDITLPTDGKNCCEITGWNTDSYQWSNY